MGDILNSIFGSSKQQTQTTTPDPVSQQLNNLRLQQLSQLFSGTPYSSFAGPRSDVYQPSAAVQQLMESAGLGDLNIPSNTQYSTVQPVNQDNLMSFDSYKNLGLDAINNYIKQIATPAITSQAALQGQERSGAVPEAIAKASAAYGLPFIQSLPGASATLTSALPQAQLINQQAQLTSNQAAALPLTTTAGIAIPLEQAKVNRATSLFPLADYGRALQEQDLLRQQGVVTTGLTGLPFTPGSSSSGRTSSNPLFGFLGQG